MARKEATRLKNQSAIQAIVDGAVREKEDDWIAILSLKFEVRRVDLNTDMGFKSKISLRDPAMLMAAGTNSRNLSLSYNPNP